ncbi:MAG: serine/threonine protein kinase [Candidatus Methylopumilus sp.]|jgi:Ser/Thr protein kinase RdoA (MazF antagonist)|nr:serine/threonine protein kinase [Candidatus Methylopumilus sp.]
MAQTTIPFSNLSPDLILDAIDSVGIATDGRLLALNSYENRVYQVGVEDDSPIVAKFYRPHRWEDAAILEEHAFVQSLADAEIPAVAPASIDGKTLFNYENFRFSIFSKHGGRAPELDQEGVLEWIGRFIGRIHSIGTMSDFKHRPTLNIETFGEEPSAYLLNEGMMPKELELVYRGVVAQALEGVRRSYDRAGDIAMLRLHGDCHMGNLLWTEAGPHFVDFDDSRMGPAIQDLWMMISGDQDEMQMQLNEILLGYEDFYDFNPRELFLIEALRTLRLIHYSAWLARRWDDPAFKVAFTWFNTQQYWQDRILELREQIALMDDPPLISGLSGNF